MSAHLAGGLASSDPRISHAHHADRPAAVRCAGNDCSLASAPVRSVDVRFGVGRDRSPLGVSDFPFAPAHAEGLDAGELERSRTLF